MKRSISFFLALTMLFSLTACGEKTAEPPKEVQPEQQTSEQVAYSFAVHRDIYEDECTAEDGTVLAHCHYELPHLDIVPEMSGDGVIDAQLLAVPNTFNEETERQRSEQVGFFDTLCDAAKEDYAYISENGLDWYAYADEMTMDITYQTEGGLLSIFASAYCHTGGVHPTNGFATWNYDLNEGKFLQYSDFTDDEEVFRASVANEILAQIDEEGIAEGLFEDYEASVRELSYAEVYFGDVGMIVCFPEYILGPHAVGRLFFTVPYRTIADLLNGRGERLLSLSTENYVLADYHEADELWRYFDMTTMPIDTEDSFEVDGYDYYRVNHRDLRTMDDLRALLLTRFSDSIVDELLAPLEGGVVHYREIDGVLYAIQCDRGSDISRGDATYAVELFEDGKGGKVIATVEELQDGGPIYNEQTGEYDEIVAGYSTIEFPFVLTETGAQFTHFESIW